MNESSKSLKQELDFIQESMDRFREILKEYPEIKQFTFGDRFEVANDSFNVWNACGDLKEYLHLIGKIDKLERN